LLHRIPHCSPPMLFQWLCSHRNPPWSIVYNKLALIVKFHRLFHVNWGLFRQNLLAPPPMLFQWAFAPEIHIAPPHVISMDFAPQEFHYNHRLLQFLLIVKFHRPFMSMRLIQILHHPCYFNGLQNHRNPLLHRPCYFK
jgi:hypothetical protein